MRLIHLLTGSSAVYFFSCLGLLGLVGSLAWISAGPQNGFEFVAIGVIRGIGLYSYLILIFLAIRQHNEIGFWVVGVSTLILVFEAVLLGPYFVLLALNGFTFGFAFWGPFFDM